MRGLDSWISRGHERQDIEPDPDPMHPDEESLLEYADEALRREDETRQAARWAERMAEDEAMGAWYELRARMRGQA